MPSSKPSSLDLKIYSILSVFFCLVPHVYGHSQFLYPNENITVNYKDLVYFTWISDTPSIPVFEVVCAQTQGPHDCEGCSLVFGALVPSNGTCPQYINAVERYNFGSCTGYITDSADENDVNTSMPIYLTSDDAMAPQTYGLSSISSFFTDSVTIAMVGPPTTAVSPIADLLSETTIPITSTQALHTPWRSLSIISTVTASATSLPSTLPLPSQSISNAAKAGISIGSVVGALLFIVTFLLVRLLQTRRKNSRLEPQPTVERSFEDGLSNRKSNEGMGELDSNGIETMRSGLE